MASIKDNTLMSVKEGSIVNFKAIAQTPLKSLRVNFTPIQQGEGDPSPENIRAISGWTGLSVYKAGKNILPLTGWDLATSNVYRYLKIDGHFDFNFNFILKDSTVSVSDIYIGVSLVEPVSPRAVEKGYHWIMNQGNLDTNKTNKITYPSTSNEIGMYVMIYPKTDDAFNRLFARYDIQIEPNNITSSTYESYNRTTIPVSWDSIGTVYGGYIDLIRGKIVAEWECITLTPYGEGTDDPISSSYVQIDFPTKLAKNRYDQICSHFKNIDSSWSNGVRIHPNSENRVVISTILFDQAGIQKTTNALFAYFQEQIDNNTPVQIGALLATPIEYDIDPITIKTLIGVNNIYSDADSVSVEYYDLESLDLYKQRFKANQPYLQTASGSVASFQTALKAPLKECKVYFSPKQAEGTPSPDNVLPISGWTGFDLYTAGKNILPHGNFTRTTNGITYNLKDDGSLTIDGQSTANAWLGVPESLYFRLPINTYTLSGNTLGYSATGYRHYMVATQIDGHSLEKYDLGSGITFTPDYAFDTVRLQAWVLSNKTISNKTVYPQLEVGSEATAFEEPVTKKSSITFPSSAGTVYGGYVDLIRGVVVEEWELSSQRWGDILQSEKTEIQETGRIDFQNKIKVLHSSSDYNTNTFCNIIDKVSWNGFSSDGISHYYGGNSNNRGVCFAFLPLNTDPDTIIQIIAKLDTPIEYQLDPITIKTLKGINNIWSNTNGNIQTKYWTYGNIADKRKVVWNQLAPEITDTNYQAYDNTHSSVTFNDGIAELIMIQDGTQPYHSALRTIKNIGWIVDHKYYIKQEIYPSEDSYYVFVFYTTWKQNVLCYKNQWNYQSYIGSCPTTGSARMFVAYPTNAKLNNFSSKIKNPILIDLTQMFGEGNEPSTATEFETLCTRNGIDLTQPQLYNEGTQMYWYF